LFLVLLVGTLFGFPRPQAAQAVGLDFASVSPVLAAVEGLKNEADAKLAEAGGKIDLNNVNVRAFLEYPGMYPTVARKIIAAAPYDRVGDVLNIPGLSERQKSTIQKYMDQFTVTEAVDALTDGDDRINNGIYR
jgi:photosystem II PsbU protein